MSIHFHRLKIKEVKKETADCVLITFVVPPELKDIYSYSHGQNITLRAVIRGNDVRRSYSICTAPYENELTVAVKEAEKGLFSGFANRELKAGDEIEVLPPTGTFYTSLHPDQKKNYLAFAAGSGITPVISIIKSTLSIEPGSQFTLVYNNRTRNSIIFLEELEALKNRYLNRLVLIHILSREKMEAPVNSGRIDNDKLNELRRLIAYEKMDDIFLCGPEAMIFTIRDYLIEKGIDKSKIHFELFNTVKRTDSENTGNETVQPGKKSNVTIKLDGRSFDFDVDYRGERILDAALKQGADLPYACKGGVCASCRARLIEGHVVMDTNWALEPEELAQGYILTCQSHPTTERVVIDFDSR